MNEQEELRDETLDAATDSPHDWPTEREPKPTAQWVGERCSTCGVKRYGGERPEVAAGPCPGPGADGVAWPVRTTTEEKT